MTVLDMRDVILFYSGGVCALPVPPQDRVCPLLATTGNNTRLFLKMRTNSAVDNTCCCGRPKDKYRSAPKVDVGWLLNKPMHLA